jgi:HSP20 family protein
MDIVKKDKGRELGFFKDRWDQMFDDIISGFSNFWPGTREMMVPLDIEETNNAILVKAELPGMSQKDIQVSVEEGILTIKGEKKKEAEEKGKTYHRIERSYGSFSRSIALPNSVDLEKVKATYKDGVLKVELGKKPEAQPRTVSIQVEK